ncbi:MAG: FliM/FliN family flagellar motor switch protein [Burkholderiaceae bacterium]
MLDINEMPVFSPVATALPSPSDLPVRGVAVSRMTQEQLRLSRQLGASCQAALTDLGNDAALVLQLAQDARADWSESVLVTGTFGSIELAQGARLLRALTGIDIAGERATSPSWLQAAVLGRLSATPFTCVKQLSWDRLPDAYDLAVVRIVLQTGSHAFSIYARGTATAWCGFIGHTQWVCNRQPSSEHDDVSPYLAVRIARHVMPARLVGSLRQGDIVVPDTPNFLCNGEGVIRWGRLTAHVNYHAPCAFTITALEVNVDLPELDIDMLIEADAAAQTATQQSDSSAALDQAPVTLDFEMGRAHMLLGELRQLTVGAIVQIDGGSPASVSIVSDGCTWGRGEAVDVNGQLGIRVTQWEQQS